MTATITRTLTLAERQEIVRQIGTPNIMAISGGRIRPITDGIELPVSSGFVVRVHLTGADDYTVERVFTRAGREFDHGTRERTYCDEVGEAAYRASCFRSYDKADWPVL